MARFELTITPNTSFPDWSAVTSPLVERALLDLLREDRMLARWQGLTEPVRETHRAILQVFRDTGRAPQAEWLAELRQLPVDAVTKHIDDLVNRDLVVLREGDIEGAYPFTDRDTGHIVEIGGVSVGAMCAIDALGVGAMFGHPTVIRSRCAHCDKELSIKTGPQGRSIQHQSSSDMVVWAGIEAVDGCAADTQCRSMIYFCSAAHLEASHSDRQPNGYRLRIAEGLEAGAAIFGPFL